MKAIRSRHYWATANVKLMLTRQNTGHNLTKIYFRLIFEAEACYTIPNFVTNDNQTKACISHSEHLVFLAMKFI